MKVDNRNYDFIAGLLYGYTAHSPFLWRLWGAADHCRHFRLWAGETVPTSRQ